MGSRAAAQALVPGRVVLLSNAASGLPELAALCGAPHAPPSRGIQLGSAAGPAGANLFLCPLFLHCLSLRWPVLCRMLPQCAGLACVACCLSALPLCASHAVLRPTQRQAAKFLPC
jgi:hypothetical protein